MQALIVSDNEVLISYLSIQLNARQVEVIIAANNDTAIEIIETRRPWLVFAEIAGREVDALVILKGIEKTRFEVSVIAIAKSFDPQEAITFMRQGLSDYIALPLEAQQKLVEKAIYRARMRALGIVDYISQHDELALQHDNVSHALKELQKDLEAGRYVQLRLFPNNPISINGFEFSHRIFPSLYLSGDFLDYFPLDGNKSFFYFADVSGHGASSAFVTIMLKTISHRWVNVRKQSGEFSPSDYLSFINKEMLKMQLGKHMTLFCGIIDKANNALHYSLAAHYPKPYYRNGGQMHVIDESALPVGIFPDAEYPEGKIKLADDFSLYLFSDGIMEIIEADSLELKEDLLFKALHEEDCSLESICNKFEISESHELLDDIGMLMLKRL
jgi:serine phosphatase RsbU (regulator of sigma subunit)